MTGKSGLQMSRNCCSWTPSSPLLSGRLLISTSAPTFCVMAAHQTQPCGCSGPAWNSTSSRRSPAVSALRARQLQRACRISQLSMQRHSASAYPLLDAQPFAAPTRVWTWTPMHSSLVPPTLLVRCKARPLRRQGTRVQLSPMCQGPPQMPAAPRDICKARLHQHVTLQQMHATWRHQALQQEPHMMQQVSMSMIRCLLQQHNWLRASARLLQQLLGQPLGRPPRNPTGPCPWACLEGPQLPSPPGRPLALHPLAELISMMCPMAPFGDYPGCRGRLGGH